MDDKLTPCSFNEFTKGLVDKARTEGIEAAKVSEKQGIALRKKMAAVVRAEKSLEKKKKELYDLWKKLKKAT